MPGNVQGGQRGRVNRSTRHPERLRPLPAHFYAASAELVAPGLLGHYLLCRTATGLSGGVIVETEAYLAKDPACHGFKGPTARNAAMFGPPGRAYVYFIYGNHWCFNAVCEKEGVPEAVLVRAIAPVFGVRSMRERRPVKTPGALTNGPAKLCQALGITRCADDVDLCATDSPVFIARNPNRSGLISGAGSLVRTTRIGISRAADWPLRFYLESSGYVSRR